MEPLIYGYGDTHQGYGPNKFLNLAKNKDITLFGDGEEYRSYLYFNIISILLECIKKKNWYIQSSIGEVNSFYDIAKIIVESTDSNSSAQNKDWLNAS